MSQTPHVKAIFIAPSAGEPMQSLLKAQIISAGIQGDRYANNTGAYSNTAPKKIRHLSLITEDAIHMANKQLTSYNSPTYTAAQTRRNIVIAHMGADTLNQLVGKTFTLGTLILKGVELCAPCERPGKLLHKVGFMNAFEGRGGLRAEVLNVGVISIGDELSFNREDLNDSISR